MSSVARQGRKDLFYSTFIVAGVIFAAIVSPKAAQAQVMCADIFQSRVKAPSSLTVPGSTPGDRQKLIGLADRFAATPVKKWKTILLRQDRRDFRDPVYTETATQILAELDQKLSAFQARESDTPVARNAHRKLSAYANYYIATLKRRTSQDRQGRGDNTSRWAIELGYHAAALFSNFSDYFVQDYMVHPEFISSIQLGSDGQKIPFTDFADRKIKIHSDQAQRMISSQFSAIPTLKIYSPEGIVELMAHGMRTYGLYSDPKKFSEFSNSLLYQVHDSQHAAEWAFALSRTLEKEYRPGFLDNARGDQLSKKDIMMSPTYRRILSRMQMLVARLKQLPEFERRAAFSLLFFMFHERPEVYFPTFARQAPLTDVSLTMGAREDYLSYFRLIEDRHDLGRGLIEQHTTSEIFEAAKAAIGHAGAGL